jgi:hypothetical protein
MSLELLGGMARTKISRILAILVVLVAFSFSSVAMAAAKKGSTVPAPDGGGIRNSDMARAAADGGGIR